MDKISLLSGVDTDHVKVVISQRSNCLIYIKSGNMVRKSGKIGKIINKIEENFYIVSIACLFIF